MQEEKNLFNQDFMAAPAWSINSGQIESGPGAFPDCSSWRALANSSGVKSPEMLSPGPSSANPGHGPWELNFQVNETRRKNKDAIKLLRAMIDVRKS